MWAIQAQPLLPYFSAVSNPDTALGFLRPPEIDQNGWFRFQDRMLTGQRRAGAEPANLVYHWRSVVCVISATHVFGPKHAARSEDHGRQRLCDGSKRQLHADRAERGHVGRRLF